MGLLTDFVIASADEAEDIGASDHPADTWPTLEAKGVETVKLASLYGAVTGTDDSEAVVASFELVGGNPEEGPWVFEFPAEVVTAMAAIPDRKLTSIAARWAETEELQMDGWSAADAAEFIDRLRAHAQQALAADASLFLWLSL